MPRELIDAGKIVNTHGVRGAVKIEPWTDTPEFLRAFSRLFIGGAEYEVQSASVLNTFVIATLSNVDTIEAAHLLRNKTVQIAKDDAPLDDGAVFVADIIGLDAIDDETGERFGEIADFLALPAHGVYVVKNDGKDDILIPAVPEFVREINIQGGFVRFRLIEGL
ncbi:MAG: ribosome maturation factor RimM [Oscillospiraceae bacterium]|jgi:16S rRNA processing protein RimM|nr:ribosome maturation factor RimM [Oscillospiraceae bacterium]